MIYCGQQETRCLPEEAILVTVMAPWCFDITSSSEVPPRDPSLGLWTLSLCPLSFPSQFFIMFPVVCSEVLGALQPRKGSEQLSHPSLFHRTRTESRQTPKSSFTLSSSFLTFSIALTNLLMTPFNKTWGVS